MFEAELIAEVETGDMLGEGLVWDARRGVFLWPDILGLRLHSWKPATNELRTRDVPYRLASFSLTRDPSTIIAAFDRGIAAFDTQTGDLTWLHEPDLGPGVRFNDGRTGPDGRFWVGTMVENEDAAGGTDRGALYCLDTDGSLRKVLTGVHISNGLCWSPDGSRLYHADSPKLKVRTYGFTPTDGTLGEAEDFIDTRALKGGPDGAVCDSEGNYWSAIWGGACVAVYTAAGALKQKIALPAPHVTCPSFGGPDLDLLAVTTARAELSDAALQDAPRSGNLFVFRTSQRGQPTHVWAGRTQAK